MNKATLIGRLGKDPEVKIFDNGKKVTKFSLATTEFFGGQKETSWHNIDIWGDYGEKMSEFMKKGSQVAIEGRISYSAYEKDGDKKVFTSIVADKVELLDSKRGDDAEEAEAEPTAKTAKPSTATATKKPSTFIPNTDSDDLPF